MLGTMEQRTAGMKKQANELIEQAYNRGHKAGYEACKEPKDVLIEKGRNEAWEAAKKIMQMNIVEKRAIFGEIGRTTYAVISELSASEAIEKLRKYEEQKKQEEEQEIRVGDEVYTEDKEIKFVVTGIGEESAHLVDCNGNFAWEKTYLLFKTGRTFPEIAEVLKKMQEGEE